MSFVRPFSRLAALCGLGLAVTVAAAELKPDELVAQFGKTVVLIRAKAANGDVSQGTGYLVSSKGALVTNYHVIKGAIEAQVKLVGGDLYDVVDVVDHDARRDLAVLKIKGFNLPSVSFADSDQAKIGERVYVIGNPRGLENTISDGLYSGKRQLEGYSLMQISAAISPGSSGSPVFNSQGQVIGTAVSQRIDGQNLNFAVPANYVRGMISDTPRTTLKALSGIAPETRAADPPKVPHVAAPPRVLAGHTESVRALGWSPDSTQLASGDYDAVIRVWDAAAGKERRVIREHKGDVLDVQWSPDGKRLASAGEDNCVALYEVGDGRTLWVNPGVKATANAVSWHPGGKLIAVAGNGETRVLDASNGKEKRNFRHASLYMRGRYNPDGTLLATAGFAVAAKPDESTGVFVVRDTRGSDWERKLYIEEGSGFADVAWSRDGTQIAVCGESPEIYLWEPKTGRRGWTLKSSAAENLALSWHPDGKSLVSVGDDGSVSFWDTVAGRLEKYIAPAAVGLADSVAWSPDGKSLAVGCADRMVRLWSAADLK